MVAMAAGIQSIVDRAMLVTISVSMMEGSKTDRKLTQETATAHNASSDMLRNQKRIVTKNALKAISDLRAEIRKYHADHTTAWSDDGARALDSLVYDEYVAWMRNKQELYDALADEFAANWQDHALEAQRLLGTAADLSDYKLSARQVRAKFGVKWTVRPIPLDSHLAVKMSTAHVENIREAIRQQMADGYKASQQDVYNRIYKAVSHMAAKLREYDPKNRGAHRFNDSLVGNIQDLVAVLPALNPTDDGMIDVLTDQLKGLTLNDAETLREYDSVRDRVAEQAEAILSQMSQFIA